MNTLIMLGMVLAALVLGGVVGCQVYSNRMFVNGGYCQSTVPGTSTFAWVKCK